MRRRHRGSEAGRPGSVVGSWCQRQSSSARGIAGCRAACSSVICRLRDQIGRSERIRASPVGLGHSGWFLHRCCGTTIVRVPDTLWITPVRVRWPSSDQRLPCRNQLSFSAVRVGGNCCAGVHAVAGGVDRLRRLLADEWPKPVDVARSLYPGGPAWAARLFAPAEQAMLAGAACAACSSW